MPLESRPNIIVFFTDQQRWDTVGCYGNPMGLTPNLDGLAAQGVRFENAFSCQPICTPARACIQTGKFGTETGVFRNRIPLAKDEKTIAHYLKDAGYETGYIGKWHLAITRDRPVPAELRGGYEYWLAADALEFSSNPYAGVLYDSDNRAVRFEKYRVDALADFAVDYLRTRTREQPFLLYLSFLEPHHQNDRNRFVAPDGYAERLTELWVPGDLIPGTGDWEESLADYYGMCRRIDENFGRVLAELDHLGLRDETLVIFTTDHGCHFKTRNDEYKRSCHEASIRIPLVMQGPGFRGGKVRTQLVSLIDLAPTLLDVAGLPVPGYMHGHSVLPLANDEPVDWPDAVLIQVSETEVGRAIRTRRWKYGVVAPDKDGWNDSGSEVYVPKYLYDLEADPVEKVNLIDNPAYQGVCGRLAAKLQQKMAEAGEGAPEIVKR
ncbi:arylsulfatase A-like enzyme [Hydrogenispora ethanolica]|uniref:Arylsulfatase A-like enzyme n=1 Tax=Hydrogenispora ethanolica TaxID=1082276 RepID=A0A4R1QV74_HYDET|nr:sulfatase-like hydrolase/transferase [Hydrogenispora ethanolica]TCL57859.1 arylsulfatase A-like enzyme [Hydrogenispora ethanolica]